MISPRRWIIRSLAYHWRIHASVALTVAIATAVLTGALVVGDSVRGSLRELALEGLGKTTFALRAPRMIRRSIADEIEGALDTDVGSFEYQILDTRPLILARGALEATESGATHRARHVQVVGGDKSFSRFDDDSSDVALQRDEIAITQALAEELKVSIGDDLLLRIPLESALPAESLLGEKSDTVAARRFRVAAILPPKGRARFSLTPSQQAPRNAFVPLAALQELLDAPDQINTILVESEPATSVLESLNPFHGSRPVERAELDAIARGVLRPSDLGIRVDVVTLGEKNAGHESENAIPLLDSEADRRVEYVNISSDALVLTNDVADRLLSALEPLGAQPVITYLANAIGVGDTTIPYSLVTGVESNASIGPVLDSDGEPIKIADDEIVLNDWAAKRLGAHVGDAVTLRFFEPDSTHGTLREHSPVTLTLRAIAPLETSVDERSFAADPFLTPQLEGVTDQKSIGDWNVPFPLDEPIGPEDESYWKERSTTPKAFISLALAKKLWATRFGAFTSIRIPRKLATTRAEITETIASLFDPAELGFAFQPVREQALAAASGTTPFDLLFLGFSMFLIASAVMLIALLFQLGVQLRAEQIGLLAAVGVSARRVRRLLLWEAAVVAAIGATIGVALGVGYAALMLWGLRTLWVTAISTPFIALHVSVWSLIVGWLLGVLAALGACWFAIRRAAKVAPRALLAGSMATESLSERQIGPRWSWLIAGILIAVAVSLGVFGMGKSGETQAGAFFGAGAAVLIAAIVLLRARLRSATGATPGQNGKFSIERLAARSAARNPTRSLLCVGLVAAASFLIVAISAFRLESTEQGAGGMEFLAESDAPIQFDLGTSVGRIELGFSDEDDARLSGADVFSFRVRDGDDASCLNLYQPARPRILGAPDDFVKRGGFEWAGFDEARLKQDHVAVKNEDLNPWTLLDHEIVATDSDQPVIPVVLDADTAAYSLKVGGVGSRFEIDDPIAGPITFQIVGLLKKSVLQGVLLISDANFLSLYPDSDGYTFFLIDAAHDDEKTDSDVDLAATLETALGDYGFDATPADSRLAQLYAVQNTYLSTFQTLGGLGLLLGTFGLAAVQLRSVVERRGEFALLRAVGFRRGRLGWMVLVEHAALLILGVGIGVFAALVAVAPHWIVGGARAPVIRLAMILTAILAVGLGASALAIRAAIRTPLAAALREE